MVCFLLHFREIYFYTSGLVLPTATAYALRKRELILSVPLLLVGVCPLFLPIIMTLVARFQAGSDLCHPDLGPKQYLQYFFLSIPYENLKVMIAILGHYRNLMSINKWEITSRKATKKEDLKEPPDADIKSDVNLDELNRTIVDFAPEEWMAPIPCGIKSHPRSPKNRGELQRPKDRPNEELNVPGERFMMPMLSGDIENKNHPFDV